MSDRPLAARRPEGGEKHSPLPWRWTDYINPVAAVE